jgi:hypothetical protein
LNPAAAHPFTMLSTVDGFFKGNVMGFISLIWGVFAMLFMLIALIPLLGWLNWAVIPFAGIGVILAAIGIMLRGEKGRRAKAGLLLNAIVIVVAVVRLSMGGGVI